jgi:hypothetical protein
MPDGPHEFRPTGTTTRHRRSPLVTVGQDQGAGHREALFWELAEELLVEPTVTRSTMMGYPCLRAGGSFFACLERTTAHLIVKLPAPRVAEMIASGQGLPFAPNGRTFREWVAFPIADPDQWRGRLSEAREFAER